MSAESQDPKVVPLFTDGREGPGAFDLASRPRGSERLRAILAQKNPTAVVAAMPVQDLYFLVNEVGLADAQELVELATPEQWQGMIDLDAWHVDHLEPALLSPWLASLVDAGPEKLTQVWSQLDPELTALVLQRWTRIYNLAEEEVPDDEEPPFYPTPDRFFMVKITATDDGTVRLVERVLDWLYRVDMVQARHTLRAAQSEPPAELEEQSYRWRAGRLADLGYAAFDEALEVYAPLDAAQVKLDEATSERPPDVQRLPAPMFGPAMGVDFLARVLKKVGDPAEAERLETALVMLLNRVLAADRVPPGDTTGAVAGSARAAATLSLGLETVARGDEAVALAALAQVSLTRLHRVGHTVGLQLGKLLAALGPRAQRADEPWATIATAVRGVRPVFPRVLDAPPEAGTRPLASLKDVARVTEALVRLGAATVLVHDVVGADPAALGDAVTLGDLGRTAVVHALLDQPVDGRPLRLPDVVELARALPGGEVPPAAREKVSRALGARAAERQVALPAEWAAVVDGWMGDLGRGVAKRGETVVLDRKFVEGLLLE